jgi:hypothetical protein
MVGKSEGRRPSGRSRGEWEDNIKVNLRKISWVWTGFMWFRIATAGGLL